MKSLLLKILKYIGIGLASILLLLFLLPMMFPGTIEQEIKAFANKKLNGELNFSGAKLSFFNHFPSLTLTLEDFSLKGSAPFEKETLVSANEVAFGINLSALIFNKTIHIDEIYLSDALANVMVNEKGEANYNVYVSEPDTTPKDSSDTALRLERIAIENTHIKYHDQSAKILVDARGFNYLGKGNLDKSIFDLTTRADIDSLDFTMGEDTYLKNKEVHAKLITQINTNKLSFQLRQNNLRINKLPVAFTGKFDFLRNGYSMYFNLATEESQLNDFFTALPPQYVEWLETASVKGETSMALTLKGDYVAAENKKPTISLQVKVRDGELQHDKAPFPMENIYLNFKTTVPSLDPEQLRVNLDSLYFNVGKDFFKAKLHSSGLSRIAMKANVQANIDLAKVDRALQLQGFALAGMLTADVKANGTYDGEKRRFPVTQGKINLRNGLVHTTYYPNPIKNIQLDAAISNGNGAFSDTRFTITKGDFEFEGKPFTLRADFSNFDDVAYDLDAKGEIDLAKLYQVFAIRGLDLKGFIKADVHFKGKQSDATAGRYNKLDNRGTLELRDIALTTEYLPKRFIIRRGNFRFHQNDMDFKTFTATYGRSDFAMDGKLRNTINFVLSDREVLSGGFVFKSNKIVVDEFMTETATVKPEPKTKNPDLAPVQNPGVVAVPKNFDLTLKLNANQVLFQGLELGDAVGNLALKRGNLLLSQTGFSIIGSRMMFDAQYQPENTKRADFGFRVNAKDFDIKRAYNEIEMFRELVSAAQYAEGIISLDYAVKGKLGADMQPIYPSLAGGGTLSVKKVKMKGFKLMGAVSKETNSPSVNDPDVSKVDIKTTIADNIINIERFKFKVAGFRPRIEGQTSFDGKLNLKMRLGLPPLGIIGIPLTVTGTQDEPKIKLGKKSQEIEKTVYDAKAPATGSAPSGQTAKETTTPEKKP